MNNAPVAPTRLIRVRHFIQAELKVSGYCKFPLGHSNLICCSMGLTNPQFLIIKNLYCKYFL